MTADPAYFVAQVLVLVSLYAAAACGASIPVVHGGVLLLCQGAFAGIGAYAVALGTTRLGWGMAPCLVLGTIAAGIVATGLATAARFIRGDRLVLLALVVQIEFVEIAQNFESLTRGVAGVPGIRRPPLLAGSYSLLIAAAILATTSMCALWSVSRGPLGRALRLMRESEAFAASVGKDLVGVMRSAFVISAVCASLSGGLFAYLQQYIEPHSFGVDESIAIVTIAILGGGAWWGPALGSLFVIALPELLRFIDITGEAKGNVLAALYGVLLVAAIGVSARRTRYLRSKELH